MSDDSKSERPLIEGLDPRQLFSEGMVDAAEAKPLIGGFQIVSKLGEGGMGIVYRAWQESLGREVALKIVRPDPNSDMAVFERIDREARAMALIEHPHIVEIYDFLQLDDGSAAIAMKLIEGETLRTLLGRNLEGLSLVTAKNLIRHVGQALRAAHSAGMVHRDVKPENVLIDLQGNAHVTDFGLALPIDEENTRLTRTGTSVGTLAYIAPEQLEGQAVDAKADQFSFGVLIYEMLTGVRPRGVIEPPHQLRKELSAKVTSILLKAMARKPGERWESVEKLCEQLLPALRPVKTVSRRTMVTSGAIAGTLAIAGVGSMAWHLLQSDWTELLPSADPAEALDGEWEREGNTLVSSEYAVLPLPVSAEELGGSYDVILEISQERHPAPYGICFQTERGMLSLDFNHWSKTGLCGIQKINEVMLNEGAGVDISMTQNEIYQFRLSVRGNELAFYQDETLLKRYTIGPGEELYNFWRWPRDQTTAGLLLVSQSQTSRFHRVAWRKSN